MTYDKNVPKGSYTHWKGDCGREASPEDVERALRILERPGQPRFELTMHLGPGKGPGGGERNERIELSLPQVLWGLERAHRMRYQPNPEPGATLRTIELGEDEEHAA